VEIVNQLGELFLSAVPTVIIVFLFYLFMRWSFFEPMARVFSERHKRAEGARSEAESTLVAAHEKERFYSDTVKKARGEIFVEQEAQRRRTLDQRQATITAARTTAQTALQEAKKEIAIWPMKLPKPFLPDAHPDRAVPRAGGRDENFPPPVSFRFGLAHGFLFHCASRAC